MRPAVSLLELLSPDVAAEGKNIVEKSACSISQKSHNCKFLTLVLCCCFILLFLKGISGYLNAWASNSYKLVLSFMKHHNLQR